MARRSTSASALDVDARGRIYVTGSVESTAHGSDVRTVSYNAAGKTRWGADGTDFWNNEVDNGDDVPWDIEVSSDAVWVTGTTYTVANGYDMLTIKYKK